MGSPSGSPQISFALAVQGPLSRLACESFAFGREELRTTQGRSQYPRPHSPEPLVRCLADFVSKLNSYQQSWEGEGKRQCPGPGDHPGLGDQDPMSQRPPASRPASHSPPGGRNIILPPVQLRDDAQPGERQGDTPQIERAEGQRPVPQATPLLPSPSSQYGRGLQPASFGEDWRSAPSRDLGVHSILNPTEPEGSSASSGRRVSGGENESPVSAVGSSSQFGASPSMVPQHTFPRQQPALGLPPTQSSYGANLPRARPTLAPRSPRSFSTGRGRGQATIDATRSPFLPSRGHAYTAEPGQSAASDTPPMPHQVQSQQHYGFPPRDLTARRTSAPGSQQVRTPHSESTSPSMSSQNPSPANNPYQSGLPPSTQGYFPGSSFVQGGGMQFASGPGGQASSSSTTEPPSQYSAPPPPPPHPSSQSQGLRGRGLQVSSAPAVASSSRRTSSSEPVQILTMTTPQGETYDFAIDTSSASRLADEKRARNATASARFRQRRKERERDAGATIDKMQSQNRDLERKVRELEQERDFYRGERDRFRDVVYRTPETRHLAMQAPPSPHAARSGSFQGPGLGPPPPLSSQGPTMGLQQDPSQERAPRRRRVNTSGEFSNVAYTLPPASTLPPVQSANYPPGSANLPPLRVENPTAVPSLAATTSGTNVPPVSTSGPPPGFEQYGRGPPGSYERSWPSERGGRR